MRDLCFACPEFKCFGNHDGGCRILTADTGKRPCPFYKTMKQFLEEEAKYYGERRK